MDAQSQVNLLLAIQFCDSFRVQMQLTFIIFETFCHDLRKRQLALQNEIKDKETPFFSFKSYGIGTQNYKNNHFSIFPYYFFP